MPVLLLIEGLLVGGGGQAGEAISPALPLLERLAASGTTGRLAFGAPAPDDLAPLARLMNLGALPIPHGAWAALGWGVSPVPGEVWALMGFTHLRRQREKLHFVSPERTGQTSAECAALALALTPELEHLGWRSQLPEGATTLLLSRPAPFQLETRPLATLEGESMADHLPAGPDAFQVGQLLNGGQMLLARHPVNQARTAAGRLPLNTPWIWGVGSLPTPPPAPQTGRFWGADPVALGLARMGGFTPRRLEEEASLAPLVQELLSSPGQRVVHLRGPGLLARHGLEKRRQEELLRIQQELLLPMAEGLAPAGEIMIVCGLPVWGGASPALEESVWVEASGKALTSAPPFWRRRRAGEGPVWSVEEARRWLV